MLWSIRDIISVLFYMFYMFYHIDYHSADLMNIMQLQSFDRKQQPIDEICRAAKLEMDLEVQLQRIVEEWSEQILSFQLNEARNIQLLDVSFAEHLIGELSGATCLCLS